MDKQLTTGRVARYLLLLAVVCIVVLGATFARYATTVQGQGSGDVAAVALGLTDGSGAVDLTSKLQGMKPGETREVKFAVTNASEGTTSEVTQAYSVSIETTGNLPLEFELTATVDKGTAATKKDDLTWEGGELPYGSSTHSYTLTVKWLSGNADSALAYEIDQVVLKVDAQQAEPTKAS